MNRGPGLVCSESRLPSSCCLLNPHPTKLLSSKPQQGFQLFMDEHSFLRDSPPDFKPEMHLEEREQARAAFLLTQRTSGCRREALGGQLSPRKSSAPGEVLKAR